MKTNICINGCTEKYYAKGMCKRCYGNVYRKDPTNRDRIKKRSVDYDKTPKRRAYILARAKDLKTREYYKEYNKSDRMQEYNRSYKMSRKYLTKSAKYFKSDHYKTIRNNYYNSTVGRAAIYNSNHKRRAQLKETDITYKWLLSLRNKTTHCSICNSPLGTDVHLDHITPLCIGGEHMMHNVRYVHEACNLGRPKDGSDIYAYKN
jgi:hypothetical protein